MVVILLKDYLKANMWELIMQYLGSMLIVFIAGYLMDLNLFHLFIADTIIVFIDFFFKYREYKRMNEDEV